MKFNNFFDGKTESKRHADTSQDHESCVTRKEVEEARVKSGRGLLKR